MEKKSILGFISQSGEWDAEGYFRRLVDINYLAVKHGFCFCRVSGLQGLEDMLRFNQVGNNFFAVSDTSDGYMTIDESARNRRVKTVFLAMRHAESDMEARAMCMYIMREIFRQLMTVLSRDRRISSRANVFIDQRVQFSEIDQYFFTGCACAYFQIAVDNFRPVCICSNDWTAEP